MHGQKNIKSSLHCLRDTFFRNIGPSCYEAFRTENTSTINHLYHLTAGNANNLWHAKP